MKVVLDILRCFDESSVSWNPIKRYSFFKINQEIKYMHNILLHYNIIYF